MKGRITLQLLLAFILIFMSSCNKQKVASRSNEAPQLELKNDDIPVVNFGELEPLLYTKEDKTYIINFWAMWCAPCVKEMPYFLAYAEKNPEVELILVSLDFPNQIETKLKPFLKKRNITADVVLLDDPDANSWIEKIDPNWSGAIPFTIIFDDKERLFYERTFENLAELEVEVNKIFKN